MLYALLQPDGAISALFREPQPGTQPLDEQHPEVLRFLRSNESRPAFDAADAEFVRVIEDLIDTLIAKNIIRHTDLPVAAQEKLIRRKGLRNQISGALKLLESDRSIL